MSGRIARMLAHESELVGGYNHKQEVVIGKIISAAASHEMHEQGDEDEEPTQQHDGGIAIPTTNSSRHTHTHTRVTFMTEPNPSTVQTNVSTIPIANTTVTGTGAGTVESTMIEDTKSATTHIIRANIETSTSKTDLHKRIIPTSAIVGKDPYGDNHHLNFQHFSKLHQKVLQYMASIRYYVIMYALLYWFVFLVFVISYCILFVCMLCMFG